jgi:hypothetical protein
MIPAFLLGAIVAKAVGERPELAPAALGAADLRLVGTVGGVAVDLDIHCDGIAVGGATEAVATCKVGTYDLAARLLRRMGCVGPAAEAIVAEELAALLSGETVDVTGIEATVKRMQATFAAKLPKVARAGAVSVKGARLACPALEMAAK